MGRMSWSREEAGEEGRGQCQVTSDEFDACRARHVRIKEDEFPDRLPEINSMLDYALLSALAAVVRTGGFEQAGGDPERDALGRCPSASKRLEERIGAVVVRGQPCLAAEIGERLCRRRPGPAPQPQQADLPGMQRDTRPVTLRIAVNADSLAPGSPAWRWADGLLFDRSRRPGRRRLARLRRGEVVAAVTCARRTGPGLQLPFPRGPALHCDREPGFVERWTCRGLDSTKLRRDARYLQPEGPGCRRSCRRSARRSGRRCIGCRRRRPSWMPPTPVWAGDESGNAGAGGSSAAGEARGAGPSLPLDVRSSGSRAGSSIPAGGSEPGRPGGPAFLTPSPAEAWAVVPAEWAPVRAGDRETGGSLGPRETGCCR